MSCINDIIGITQNTSLPFWADLSDDVKAALPVSNSGLFVSDLPGGIDLSTIDDSTYMIDILNKALQAKAQAERVLADELLTAINNRYQAAKINFHGDIGRRSVSATLPSTGENQGHRYRMYEPIAGNIRISAINVCITGAATFNVYVGRCDAQDKAIVEILYTLPVTTTAGMWSAANLASVNNKIILPMEVNGIEQEYYIFWKRSETGMLLPKNNEIKCGTCPSSRGISALDGYMYYNGVSVQDMEKLHNATSDKKGHGLSVSAIVGCEHDTVICREYEKKENIAKLMSWAALYQTGVLWIEYIQQSGFVNRDNMLNRDYLWGKRNHYQKEFDERITVIANQMTLGETNCYSCRDDRMIKGTIFS